jgi:uncharacterized protein (DUF2225 family)
VQLVPGPESHDIVVCPTCGVSDTFENVKRSLGEQDAEQIFKTMCDTLKGVKAIEYTPRIVEKKFHRFVVKQDL